jgi:Mannosylglycerate hydrolase MGH1-like glycoside hydrolase domain
MNRSGDDPDALWDEADGFYYDVLRLPDGSAQRLKVRSLVGLLPLCAATVLEADVLERFPALIERVRHFVAAHPALGASLAHVGRPGAAGRRLLSALDEAKLRRVLGYLLDEGEFLGPHGIRAVSRVHADRPFVVAVGGQEFRVHYEPAESTSGLFGGNSNWRGPVWFPINALLIRALRQLYAYYGDDFTVECPTGSGRQLTLYEVSRELAARLEAIFLRDATGRRPVHGGAETFQTDPHWRDLLLFYEYFHGDNGAGIGASHQTGWTGLVAALIRLYGVSTQERLLAEGPRGGARGPG